MAKNPNDDQFLPEDHNPDAESPDEPLNDDLLFEDVEEVEDSEDSDESHILKVTEDDFVDIEDDDEASFSNSAIDLDGEQNPAESSEEPSSFAWSSLVDDGGSSTGGGDVTFDAPSDQDILLNADTKEPEPALDSSFSVPKDEDSLHDSDTLEPEAPEASFEAPPEEDLLRDSDTLEPDSGVSSFAADSGIDLLQTADTLDPDDPESGFEPPPEADQDPLQTADTLDPTDPETNFVDSEEGALRDAPTMEPGDPESNFIAPEDEEVLRNAPTLEPGDPEAMFDAPEEEEMQKTPTTMSSDRDEVNFDAPEEEEIRSTPETMSAHEAVFDVPDDDEEFRRTPPTMSPDEAFFDAPDEEEIRKTPPTMSPDEAFFDAPDEEELRRTPETMSPDHAQDAAADSDIHYTPPTMSPDVPPTADGLLGDSEEMDSGDSLDDLLTPEESLPEIEVISAEDILVEDDEEMDVEHDVDLGADSHQEEEPVSGAYLLEDSNPPLSGPIGGPVEIIEEDSESVQLGEEPRAGDPHSSRRDLIAEEVESGVGVGSSEDLSKASHPDSFDDLLLGEESYPTDDSVGEELEMIQDINEDNASSPHLTEEGLEAFLQEDSEEEIGITSQHTVDESLGELIDQDDMVDLGEPAPPGEPEGESAVLDFGRASTEDLFGDDDEVLSEEAILDEDVEIESVEDVLVADDEDEEIIADDSVILDEEDVDLEAIEDELARTEEGEDGLAEDVLLGEEEEIGLTPADIIDSSVALQEEADDALIDEDALVALEDDEEEVEPAKAVKEKPARKPKYGRRWFAGMLLGVLLFGGGAMGAWALGLFEIPKEVQDLRENPTVAEIRDALGLEAAKDGGSDKTKTGPQKGAITPEDVVAQIESNPSKSIPADQIALLEDDNPQNLRARGLYYWAQSAKQIAEGKEVKETDPSVTDAIQYLEKAIENSPAGEQLQSTARLQLGEIYEEVGNHLKAKETYVTGLSTAKTKQHKEYFANRLLRMLLRGRLQPNDAVFERPELKDLVSRGPGRADRFQLALLLIALQGGGNEGGDEGKDKPDSDGEAGTLFWQALAKANTGQNYSAAKTLIDEAKKLHARRRFTRLRQSQNPLSDPTEEIFLQVCEELSKYWGVKALLQKEMFIAKMQNDPVVALNDLIADRDAQLTDKNKMITGLQTTVTDQKKMIDGLNTTVADQKKMIDGLNTTVADQKKMIDGLNTTVADQKKMIDGLNTKVTGLEVVKKDLEGVIGTLAGKLAKTAYLDQRNIMDRKAVYSSLDKVIDVAYEKDPKARILKTENEIADLQDTLKERRDPRELLNVWIAILQDRNEVKQIPEALRDVKRARDENLLEPNVEAKAKFIEALASRNQGDYEKARKLLEAALESNAPEFMSYKEFASTLQKEMSDPEARYLPLARQLRQDRRYAEALALTAEGLKVFPANNGRIHGLRALILLDQVRPNAKGIIEPSQLDEARKEALLAINVGADGLGHYAYGRIEEALKQYPKAAKSYESALDARKTNDTERAEYQLALARVLLRGRRLQQGNRLRLQKDAQQEIVRKLLQKEGAPTIQELLILMTTAVQVDVPPLGDPQTEKAIQLADEVLKRPDIDRFPLLKARAYLIKGMWTDGLKSYVTGLEPYLDREMQQELADIVNRHPRLQISTVQRLPNPLQAQRHYANGLSFFYERKYVLAEKEFNRAIQRFDEDARFYYYLGLAQLIQGKQVGRVAIVEGAKLEANDRPSAETVNTALEQVQGPLRSIINKARDDAYSEK